MSLVSKVLKLPDKHIQDLYNILLEACDKIEAGNLEWRQVFRVSGIQTLKQRKIYRMLYDAHIEDMKELIDSLTK